MVSAASAAKGRAEFGERQPARCLPHQHRHVPAQRQERAPGLRERVHAQGRKSHARIAERGRDDEAGEAEAGREVAHQKLQQRPQRQVADDEQRTRDDHHRHVALEGNPEHALQYERHRQHDDEKNPEQGRKLAGERDDWVAARAGEPGAHAAPAKLGADRVGGGERDDHVDDHRQQRAQQELRVVRLRIDQHDRLGDKRSDAGRFWRRRGRGAADSRREAVAQARGRDAPGRQILLVIEGDDLRAPLGFKVTLEIRRHVDGGNGLTGSYRLRRRREIAGAFDDAEIGRRRHLFHEGTRGGGSVRVDDDQPQPADHRVTEHRGQDRQGEQRHAEDQYDGHAIMQQPSPFAPGDEPKSGLWRRLHSRFRQSK